MDSVPAVVLHLAAFGIVALAAKLIGQAFSRFGLPYITGYLLAGALAGPFVLGMLPAEASAELRFVDDIALAIIAFIAGSELYLNELRARLRAILLNTAGIVVFAFVFIGVALWFLQSFIPFTAGLPNNIRLAISVLGATILLALSPASTIAVIQDARARGPFSKTVLSVTVVMDVVIVVLFAVSVALAGSLIDGEAIGIGLVVLLAIDIVLGVLIGYAIGQMIGAMLSTRLPNLLKIALLIGIGFLIFEFGFRLPDWTYTLIGQKIAIEPLLVAMTAGFTVTNFTRHRHAFEDLLHQISPATYVAFFALTGLALKLDILFATLGIALLLFAVRIVSIGVGTLVGGTIAGEAPAFRRWAWLGLITQAGIALGLARETAVEFPDILGSDFTTLMVSVIVLNEIFGPMFFKFALRRVGEAVDPAQLEGSGGKLLILGIEPQSVALARQLSARQWDVVIVDTDEQRIEQLAADDVDERYIPEIDEPTLVSLFNGGFDAMVALLASDDDNLRACQIAYENVGTKTMVARLNDLSKRDAFDEMGVRVLDTTTAMVNLLHQYVQSPDAVELLLFQDPDHEIMQITVCDDSLNGLALRDLRLPRDVLVLEIKRNGQAIVPHGFSTLNCGDEVTLIGSPDGLAQAALKMS